MKRTVGWLAGISLAVSLSTAAFAQDDVKANTVLATVDGVNITLGHVVALRGRLPEQYQQLEDAVLFPAILDQLIQQTALMNTIKGKMDERLALSLENEKRAFLAAEVRVRASENELTEEAIQSAYNERYDSVLPEPEFNASHILVETEEEVLELINLLQDGADFAELAKEKSTGPSGPNGGSLGWFGLGAMVPPFEEAVQKMAVGEISSAVQTQFGWHVLILNDLRTQPVPTLDEVRPNLVAEMQADVVAAEIQKLTEEADIVRAEVDIDPAIIRDVSIFDE